jgi:indolepyruvate ferredoxin oxidoreductase beta subunit
MADLSYDIVLAGRGGQGVIYLSKIMGQAALLQGLGVRTTETHGLAMRGGSVQCFVRVGDVHGPLFKRGSAALIMALHPDGTPLALPLLGEDGVVLVNSREREIAVTTQVKTQDVLVFDADDVAVKYGNPRSANLALLGGAVAMVNGFPLEAAFIEKALAGSGSERVMEKNLEIFRAGLSAGS